MLALLVIFGQTCSAPYVCVDGDQTIGNQKVFTGLVQAYGSYASGGESISLIVINGMRVGGQISPALDGNSVVLRGRRAPGDSAAGVIVLNEHLLDAGGYLAVNAPNAQLFVVDWKGNVIASPAPDPDGTQADDVLHRGMFVSANGASGAVALQSAPGSYLVLEYRLPEQCAKLPDGGEPEPDGGTEIECRGDGGCCLAYAGKHGGFTTKPSVAQRQGWLWGAENAGVYGSGMKFGVHATGAFGQMNGLVRSQFPTCPSPLAMTSLGQFYPGVPPGVLAYAADEDTLYRCSLCGWRAVP